MRLSFNPHIRPGISLRARPSPQADTQPDTRVDTRQSAPFEVGLISSISLHKFLVKNILKYTKLIDVICFDHMTRFLSSDWLQCRITLQL